MSTDNIRVINEEYERVLQNPDNLIMSDGLMERMSAFTEELLPEGADSHDLYVSFTEGIMDVAHISGTLHTLRQLNKDEMSVSFEVSAITQDVLKKLHSALSKGAKTNIKLAGMGGFSCTDAEISHWDYMKVAPHQLLLSITFGGSNVTF